MSLMAESIRRHEKNKCRYHAHWGDFCSARETELYIISGAAIIGFTMTREALSFSSRRSNPYEVFLDGATS